MKIPTIAFRQILSFSCLVALAAGSASGQTVLDSGDISVQAASGGGFLGGTSTFNLTAAEIALAELSADFFIVDAGVDVSINGTSLFPQFTDLSQFGPTTVFTDTGIPSGGIEDPFTPNSFGLPRLTINSTFDGTTFSGAETVGASSPILYTPNFIVEDFASLLVVGQNTIEFDVLNAFEGANLQGNYTVSLSTTTTAVPEPGTTSLAFLAFVSCLATRRRSA